MERTVTATEARVHFGELMRCVTEGDDVVIVERSGQPQVVVMSIDAYHRLQEGRAQPAWRDNLRDAHAAVRRDLAGRPMPDVSEIMRQSREERDEQLLDALRRR